MDWGKNTGEQIHCCKRLRETFFALLQVTDGRRNKKHHQNHIPKFVARSFIFTQASIPTQVCLASGKKRAIDAAAAAASFILACDGGKMRSMSLLVTAAGMKTTVDGSGSSV